ncbi:hypothetical protein HDU83_001832 [Entophlyctis luteolus]|nr:hypothetical protein HDU83_001832 [Entophlyctis luteolus]
MSTGTVPEEDLPSVSIDRLRAILSAVLARAWPSEAQKNTCDGVAHASCDELVVAIVTRASAFATLKSTPPTSTLAEGLRSALTTHEGLRNLVLLNACAEDGTPWAYVLRFKGGAAAESSDIGKAAQNPAAFNGTRVIMRLDDIRDSVMVESLGVGTEEPTEPAQSLQTRTSFSHHQIESVLKYVLIKTRIVELAISFCLARPANTIVPIGPLSREIRREYYRKYITPTAALLEIPAPPFNLLIDLNHRDYDITMVSPVSQTPTPKEESSKKYKILRRDWSTARSLLTRQTVRKLLVEQVLHVPLAGSDGGDDGVKYACVDVIELQHSGDEYPWGVRCFQLEGSSDLEDKISISEWWATKIQPVADRALNILGNLTEKNGSCVLKGLNLNCLLGDVQAELDQVVLPGVTELMEEIGSKAKVRREVMKSIKNYSVDNSGFETEKASLLEKYLSVQALSTMSEQLSNGLIEPLMSLLQRISPPRDLQPRRLQFLTKLQTIITSGFGLGYTARLFGSSLTTLASTTSDADVTILLDNVLENPNNHPISNMYLLANVLRYHGMQKVLAIATARVPIVKFYDPEYDLHVDVNVGNTLGIENSRMVCEYMRLDPRLRDVILLVKHWAARRRLNDSSGGGTFSSYALILMIMHCMQLHGHLPSLQSLYPDSEPRKYVVSRPNIASIKSNTAKNSAKAEASIAFEAYKARVMAEEKFHCDKLDPQVDLQRIRLDCETGPMSSVAVSDISEEVLNEQGLVKWDVSFVDAKTAKKIFETNKSPTSDGMSVLTLLHGFFYHFGYKHIYKADKIVSVRCGRVISLCDAHPGLAIGRAAEAQQLVVEDPFQLDRNATGMVKRIGFVVDEFRRMARLLSHPENNSDWAAVLDEAFSEINL